MQFIPNYRDSPILHAVKFQWWNLLIFAYKFKSSYLVTYAFLLVSTVEVSNFAGLKIAKYVSYNIFHFADFIIHGIAHQLVFIFFTSLFADLLSHPFIVLRRQCQVMLLKNDWFFDFMIFYLVAIYNRRKFVFRLTELLIHSISLQSHWFLLRLACIADRASAHFGKVLAAYFCCKGLHLPVKQ